MREPCAGSICVIPIPPGYTIADAWNEMTTLGHLMPYEGEPLWANVWCPGGFMCRCKLIDGASADA